MIEKRYLKNIDWIFVAMVAALLVINLVVLKSASTNVSSDSFYYVKRQFLWICLGLVALVAVLFFDYQYFARISFLIYGFNLLLLVGVLFMPAQKGAHRWYDLGFMDFQPSELAKILMIICFACFLAKREHEMGEWKNILAAFAFMGLPMLLIFAEPDLGTSLVFVAILFAMLWVGGLPPKIMLWFILIILFVVLFIFFVLFFYTDGYQHLPEELPWFIPLKGYQLTRLIIFINPEMDPLDAGYHMIQSEIAIGSGGFWGKGYGKGSQVQGNFLPEHHTDFIFSVGGEEFGFVGSFLLLALYFGILGRAVMIAYRAKDLLGSLIVIGVAAMFGFQIFINAGMTIGIMPITGLPMPFLSYGGSSMLINMLALGLVLNVNMRSAQRLF
ncbi:MAG: rod shape-determining protein RodA [Peptococcaceae bacterium]|nr:rod shape-determining protein RodA [Peptococcaceae bacterium]